MSISKTAYVDEIVSALTDFSSKLKGLLSDSYTEDKVSAAPGAPVPTAPKDVYSLIEKQFRGYQEAHSRARAKIEEVARKYFSVTADLMCDVPEDAARILGVLNMRSSITGEELDAVIEK